MRDRTTEATWCRPQTSSWQRNDVPLAARAPALRATVKPGTGSVSTRTLGHGARGRLNGRVIVGGVVHDNDLEPWVVARYTE